MDYCNSFLSGLSTPHFYVLWINSAPFIHLTKAVLELNYAIHSAHKFLKDSCLPLGTDSEATDARFIALSFQASSSRSPHLIIQWVPPSAHTPLFTALLPLIPSLTSWLRFPLIVTVKTLPIVQRLRFCLLYALPHCNLPSSVLHTGRSENECEVCLRIYFTQTPGFETEYMAPTPNISL